LQTFLPYADFNLSAQMLDVKRLGKQRLETMQILKALTNPDYGWQHHPATQMWRGHGKLLVSYGVAICNHWRSYGYKDTCLEKIEALDVFDESEQASPWWLGKPELHASHRAMLFRKDPVSYQRLANTFSRDITDYFWPRTNKMKSD
jgi:hypothetical protein